MEPKMTQVLVVIDMQIFIEERIHAGVGFFPEHAIQNMAVILDLFRQNQQHIIHIMHQSADVNSALHQDAKTYPMMSVTKNRPDEPIFIKNTSSAFESTMLADYLTQIKADEVVVIGGVTGFCVNSTIRQGADLGFNMSVIADATISFDLISQGQRAENIHQVSMALIDADFAQVKSTQQVIESVESH